MDLDEDDDKHCDIVSALQHEQADCLVKRDRDVVHLWLTVVALLVLGMVQVVKRAK